MRKLLEDILEAGRAIRSYTAARTEADYNANPMLRDAVERRFEIIGEALRRLRDLDAATFARISDAGQIINFRNVLAHGYDIVEDDRVWHRIGTGLPLLLQEAQALAAEIDGEK